MANFNFNANEHEPAGEMGPLPPDWYKVVMIDSKIAPTKDQKGKRLNCIFNVLEGKYKGRQIWEGYNILNKSDVAVQIAMSQISAICHAVGKKVIKDTGELHNIPFLMRVDVVPATAQYKAKNEILAVKPLVEKKESVSEEQQAPEEGSTDSEDAPWERAAG